MTIKVETSDRQASLLSNNMAVDVTATTPRFEDILLSRLT